MVPIPIILDHSLINASINLAIPPLICIDLHDCKPTEYPEFGNNQGKF